MVEIHEVENALRRARPAVVTAPILAEDLDCSSEHVRQHLQALESVEKVESLSAGARARVYWHSSRMTPPEQPPEDHPDQARLEDERAGEQRDDQDDDQDDDLEESAEPDLSGGIPGTVEKEIATIDPPGREEQAEARREAVRAAYRWLQTNGPATATEIIENVQPSHSAGYQKATRKGGWWRSLVKPALEDLPGVMKPAGGQPWRIEN